MLLDELDVVDNNIDNEDNDVVVVLITKKELDIILVNK